MLIAAWNARQFMFKSAMVAMPMGGVVMNQEVIGFRYESVQVLLDEMVPPNRRREVFEKFRCVEPYAVRAAGGGDATGSVF